LLLTFHGAKKKEGSPQLGCVRFNPLQAKHASAKKRYDQVMKKSKKTERLDRE